jgi:hypothetical protein
MPSCERRYKNQARIAPGPTRFVPFPKDSIF